MSARTHLDVDHTLGNYARQVSHGPSRGRLGIPRVPRSELHDDDCERNKDRLVAASPRTCRTYRASSLRLRSGSQFFSACSEDHPAPALIRPPPGHQGSLSARKTVYPLQRRARGPGKSPHAAATPEHDACDPVTPAARARARPAKPRHRTPKHLLHRLNGALRARVARPLPPPKSCPRPSHCRLYNPRLRTPSQRLHDNTAARTPTHLQGRTVQPAQRPCCWGGHLAVHLRHGSNSTPS